MPNTLYGRLLLSSLLVLSVFFGLIGYTINQLTYQKSLINKQKQLRLQNYVLMSSADIDKEKIHLPDELRERRFDEFESGLYGYISDETGKILWRSYSAHDMTINKTLLKSNSQIPGNAEFTESNQYYIYHYTVRWEVITDHPQLLTFTVLEDSTPNLEQIREFQKKLSFWFLLIGLTLIVLMMAILRWGTKPLRQLASKLKQVERGTVERLEGNYPLELHGLANNLNALINTERKQRERYRTTLADLAHSLKTPLAVIQAQLQVNNNHDKQHTLITEQAQRMEEIIKHQLQRAVLTTPHELTQVHSVKTCIERITTALEKVHAEKGIRFTLDVADGTLFKGDLRDLIEVLGNVLDNACKACDHVINITAIMNDQWLAIDIHDDGKGIAPHLRDTIVKRGERADTKHSGQGIGLAVTRDIIESYKGQFNIDDSPIGGALIKIRFPYSPKP